MKTALCANSTMLAVTSMTSAYEACDKIPFLRTSRKAVKIVHSPVKLPQQLCVMMKLEYVAGAELVTRGCCGVLAAAYGPMLAISAK